ncbi:hypothetical protein Jinkies_38 [Arthrobacter phage Jinkies]|uniref:Uncharacterized protein n=1 Tax=Arthrobacter phage Jinkies TaxID=2743903 RepID=A0A7S6BF82_9CAUD|nr:hypothetical protein Jinkies_38 [Arthrobacter phage Jinkies]
MKGLRLTKRGEIVRDAVIVTVSAGLFFPVMTVIIAVFNSIGVQ